MRIHSGCVTGEVFGSTWCDCAWQLRHANRYIVKTGVGLIIYAPWQEGRGNGIVAKIRSLQLMDLGLTSQKAFESLKLGQDERRYDVAIAVLRHLGLGRLRLLTNNPLKLRAIVDAGFDVRRVRSWMRSNNTTLAGYLLSKRIDLGHME